MRAAQGAVGLAIGLLLGLGDAAVAGPPAMELNVIGADFLAADWQADIARGGGVDPLQVADEAGLTAFAVGCDRVGNAADQRRRVPVLIEETPARPIDGRTGVPIVGRVDVDYLLVRLSAREESKTIAVASRHGSISEFALRGHDVACVHVRQGLARDVNVERRRLAGIGDDDADRYGVAAVGIPVAGEFKVNRQPRTLVESVRIASDLIGFASFVQSPYEQSRSDRGEYSLPSCQRLLPLGGERSLPLSVQIGVITLLGAASLGGAAFGLARIFSSTDGFRPSDRLGWCLIVVGLPIGLTLYSLAALGDWRAVFGLCRFPGY